MYPIELTIPPAEREQATRLGARWNEQEAQWYVPRTCDPKPLGHWLTARIFPNICARSLWLACTFAACPWCEKKIPLHGLIVPAGHLALCPDDDPDDDTWEDPEEPAQLYEVGYLSDSLQAALQAQAPSYRLGYSERLERFCWINHCPHCQLAIEDQECALEFGSPLNPLDESMAARITLREIRIEFEAFCGCYGCGVQFFEDMPRTCA